jgi:hypothetical protein
MAVSEECCPMGPGWVRRSGNGVQSGGGSTGGAHERRRRPRSLLDEFQLLEHYIRQGEDGSLVEDDDFFLWIRLHLTVNATGVPTAERMEFEFDCR